MTTQETPVAAVRRGIDAAQPTQYALLGLLWTAPGHGYELARQFAPHHVLGDIVHVAPSYIYALLGRLEASELIAGTEQREVVGRPPRRIFRLTASGRAAVLHWSSLPVHHTREMPVDFPLKLFVAQQVGSHQLTTLLVAQRALLTAQLTTLRTAAADGDALQMALRGGRVARTEAALRWVDECAALFGVDI